MKTLKFKEYNILNEGSRRFKHRLFTEYTPELWVDQLQSTNWEDEDLVEQLNNDIRDTIQKTVDYNNDWEERIGWGNGSYVITAMKNLEIKNFDSFLKNGFCGISDKIEETYIYIHVYSEVSSYGGIIHYDGIPELYHVNLGYDTYEAGMFDDFINKVIEFQMEGIVDELEDPEFEFDTDEIEIFKKEIAKEINKMTNAFVKEVEVIVENVLDKWRNER